MAVRPRLWGTAVRALYRFIPTGGLRSEGGVAGAVTYAQWRLQTAYGDRKTKPSAHDFVEYLQWMHDIRMIMKPGASQE